MTHKDVYITPSPIPKVCSVTADGDHRPIYFTHSMYCKSLKKDFAQKWLIENVRHKIDP